MLLLRVYDELKDVEADLALGREGDERYKNRPIVTGAITVDDLLWLRNAILVLLVLLNVGLGAPWPLLAFAVMLLCAWLSSRWYFYPPMKKYLLLAFATHNPLTLVLYAYVAAVGTRELGTSLLRGDAWLVIVGLWLPIAAWETSRKIRIPTDETSYVTYSKILGHRRAAMMPASLVTISTICLLTLARRHGVALWFQVAILVTGVIVVGRCLQFVLAPTSQRAQLRPFVEAFVVVATAALVAALVIGRGVRWIG